MSRGSVRLILTAICAAAALAPAEPALAIAPPRLAARAAILVAPATGQTLYGVAVDRKLAIASATKLMTALITLERVRHLNRMLTQNEWYPSSVDSQINLVPGERMSVHDLLVALLLPSADDAAEDLAFNIGHGSVARFVGMMNVRARELGLTRTHFSTPSGLDTPGNYSTAADLVRLAAYDLDSSAFFARVVALRSAVLHTGDQPRTVVNRNDLVGAVPWIDGVKTGHTGEAGYVLVAAGHRGGMRLVSAVLGTASEQARDASTMALLDYGFANFRTFTPVRAGEVLAHPPVRYRSGERVDVLASSTFHHVLARRTRIRLKLALPRRLTGPLRRGADVGTAVVLADGRPIARIPLLLARALPAVAGLTVAAGSITEPVLLLAALAAIGGAVSALLVQRRRRSAAARLEAA